MLKIRSYHLFNSTLSLVLLFMMVLPAQGMMLWCDMMDLHQDMSMQHESMPMNMHDASGDTSRHCDSKTADPGTPQESDDHCTVSLDCNCILLQGSDWAESALKVSQGNAELLTVVAVTDFTLALPSPNEYLPPPIWSSSSYSPPSLFLANESLLI